MHSREGEWVKVRVVIVVYVSKGLMSDLHEGASSRCVGLGWWSGLVRGPAVTSRRGSQVVLPRVSVL